MEMVVAHNYVMLRGARPSRPDAGGLGIDAQDGLWNRQPDVGDTVDEDLGKGRVWGRRRR